MKILWIRDKLVSVEQTKQLSVPISAPLMAALKLEAKRRKTLLYGLVEDLLTEALMRVAHAEPEENPTSDKPNGAI